MRTYIEESIKIAISNRKKISFGIMLQLIRGFFLKLKVSNVGFLPLVDGKCIINNYGHFTIGNKFSIRSKPLPVFITVYENANLTIGNNVFLNYGVDIGCKKQITIGNNVAIGDLTNIIDSSFHQVDSNDIISSKEIIIQDNVWIGNHSIILPGVCIGRNSVIAAGSVVTHNVPDNVLVAGVPAKIIRELFITEGWIRQ